MVKRPYDFLQNTVGKFVGKYLSPNQLSVIAFLLACISTFFYVKRMFYHAVFSLLISGIVDGLDGMVARAIGKSSIHGELYDAFLDRLSETILFLGLAYSGLANPLLVGITISGVLFLLVTRLMNKVENITACYEIFSGRGIIIPKTLFIIIFTFIDLNIGLLLIASANWLLVIFNSWKWFRG